MYIYIYIYIYTYTYTSMDIFYLMLQPRRAPDGRHGGEHEPRGLS